MWKNAINAVHRDIPKYIRGFTTTSKYPCLPEEAPAVLGISTLEFANRRHALMRELGRYMSKMSNTKSQHLLLFPASEIQYMAYHVPYPFHQNPNFLYFTGFHEPNAVLAISVSLKPQDSQDPEINFQEHLFVEVRTPHSEMWDGPMLGVEKSSKLTGIQSTESLSELPNFLATHFLQSTLWYSPIVQRDLDNQTPNKFVLGEVLKLKRKLQSNAREIKNPDPLVDQLRFIKSPKEIEIMKIAASITSNCLAQTMSISQPEILESDLLNHMQFAARKLGSELGYPPVIAGGERAHIIHYLNNDQPIHDGELVLMDTGCRYAGYTADMTRTWPINGEYTSAQRVLHEILEATQNACAKAASPDRSLHDLHEIMLTELERHLVTERIISDANPSELVRKLCPHFVGHYLGLDVHDTPSIPHSRSLQPGVVFPLEPGLYLRQKLANKGIRKEFVGIGMRLEDDFFISNEGLAVRLHESMPTEARLLESIVKRDEQTTTSTRVVQTPRL